MNALIFVLLAVAWLAIIVLLWRAVRALPALFADRDELPFFEVLRRRSLTLPQVEAGVGVAALAGAVRRCALCSGRRACIAELAADSAADPAGEDRFDCPNAALLRRSFDDSVR